MAVSELVKLLTALNRADNALNGRYPWPVHGPFTQKEARAAASKSTSEAVAQAVSMLKQAGFNCKGFPES